MVAAMKMNWRAFWLFVLAFMLAQAAVAELGSFDVPKPRLMVIDCGN